jgi:glucan endo-1,3-alpha-glucosidase
MWAAVFATSNANVMLQCGSSSSTFSVTPGVNKLKIPLSEGTMTVKMTRNGQTIIHESSQGYSYVLVPTLCAFFFFFKWWLGFKLFNMVVLDNYNAWVGSASKFLTG